MYSTDLDSPISKSNSNATRAHSSTLRSNASSAFYYYSGGRRRSRPFTYGFGVGGGRKRRSKGVQNWIRCLTVFAYFILVSSPALLLSFYYTRIWDPTYLNKMVSPPSSGNFGVIGNAGSRKFMAISGHGRVEKLSLRDILPKGTIGNGNG